jgi:hypothetical protein
MGWLPDYPSFKDYTPQSENIAPLFKKVDLGDTIKEKVVRKNPYLQNKILENGVLR